MNKRLLSGLFLLGLVFYFVQAYFQRSPGYIDADYYFAGGLRLAQGHGFSEIYLWNYLDNPQTLPHPSHAYWFPLASIIAALGMLVTGQLTFFMARLGFILIAALCAPVTAILAHKITGRQDTAFGAGVLAVFCGYHASSMSTTDNYGVFMLLGGLFFLILGQKHRFSPVLLGLVAGLMNLARPDGLIWFFGGLAGLSIAWFTGQSRARVLNLLTVLLLFSAGYFLVMGPWMARNLSIWGTPITPAGNTVLWMTRYSDTFAWPPTRINMQTWLAAGWQSALAGRWEAIKLNTINSIGAQAAFVLFPFILAGLWSLRRDWRVRQAVATWLALFFVMSIIFPFAGSRGSFFHADAALLPIWFTAAVVGVERLALRARARGMFTPAAPQLFRFGLIMMMVFLTPWLSYVSIVQRDWNRYDRNYSKVEEILQEHHANSEDAVIVANAPGYFAISGRKAIIVPSESLETVQTLARKFGAKFLVLEDKFFPDTLKDVYENPENQPGLTYLGGFNEVRIYEFNR